MNKKLSEICDIQSGGTPSRSVSEYWTGGNIPWVKISDFEGKSLQNTEEFITEEGLNNSSAKIFKAGTILYTIFATIGEVCILNIDAATNQAIAGITIKNDAVNKDYLYHYLCSLKKSIIEKGRGVAQNNINMTILKNIEIPLPPIEIQREIAYNLDKAAEAVGLCRKILEKLDYLVKAKFTEMFGEITDTVPLSHYISSLTAGKSLAGEEVCKNKVLKTGAVSYDYFDETQVKFLPKDYTPQKEHMVHAGDVIISRMNTTELVGAAAYVWHTQDNTYLPDRLWKAELRSTAEPVFIWQVLIQRDTKERIRKIGTPPNSV